MRSATCLTPPGRSAIASIQVCGFDSLAEFDSCFRSAGSRSLSQYSAGRVVFGFWSNRFGTTEELVVSLVSPQTIEIHCHGGAAAVSAILDSLSSLGFDIRQPEANADAPSRRDLETELQQALLQAPTRKIANRLLELMSGSFSRAIQDLKQQILEAPELAANQLRQWQNSFETGQFLVRPVQVILAGSPNVGKSSLNNRILGYDRSIVYDQPGTTRDVVSDVTTIDGWSFEFSDTAGLRKSGHSIESIGIDLARKKLQQADLVIWVSSPDVLAPGSDPTREEPSECEGYTGKLLHVLNKVDLLDEAGRSGIQDRYPNLLLTNAVTGEGIETLLKRIRSTTVQPEPAPGNCLLFTGRQLHLVEKALAFLAVDDRDSALESLLELEHGK